MDNQFLRTQMLLGGDAMNQLHRSHVAVFGLGGVGSYAVEALVRSGVGELTLIDDDTVSPTNLNRQLEALHSTVGQNKTDALAARCRDINPDVRLHLICARYDAAHREDFFTARYDYILDAIDTVSSKLDLIQTAQARGIPILSAMGTGNKLDASQLCITDISKTRNCSLARVMRKELRDRGVKHLRVIYSPELPAKPEALEAPRRPPQRTGKPRLGPRLRGTDDGGRRHPDARPDAKKRKKAAANDFDRYHRQFRRDRRGQHRRTSARQVYPRALQRRNGKGRGALRALHRRGRHARGRKYARRHPFDRDRRDPRRTFTAR